MKRKTHNKRIIRKKKSRSGSKSRTRKRGGSPLKPGDAPRNPYSHKYIATHSNLMDSDYNLYDKGGESIDLSSERGIHYIQRYGEVYLSSSHQYADGNKPTTIYALLVMPHGDTRVFVYIGKSKDPTNRLYGHLQGRGRGSNLTSHSDILASKIIKNVPGVVGYEEEEETLKEYKKIFGDENVHGGSDVKVVAYEGIGLSKEAAGAFLSATGPVPHKVLTIMESFFEDNGVEVSQPYEIIQHTI